MAAATRRWRAMLRRSASSWSARRAASHMASIWAMVGADGSVIMLESAWAMEGYSVVSGRVRRVLQAPSEPAKRYVMYKHDSQDQMSKKEKPTAEQRTERFGMRASPSVIKRIDEWRRQQPDLPSR